MWHFVTSTGELTKDGEHKGFGYSGKGSAKNDPRMQSVHNQGPIPVGLYDIDSPVDTVTHGPYVLPLRAHPENEMYGRSGFLIHGDNVTEPGTASEGCIILNRIVRHAIWESGDHLLRVESGL